MRPDGRGLVAKVLHRAPDEFLLLLDLVNYVIMPYSRVVFQTVGAKRSAKCSRKGFGQPRWVISGSLRTLIFSTKHVLT